MRQKLRADGAAEGEIDGDGKERYSNGERGPAMDDGRADRGTIVPDHPFHQRIPPLFGAFAKSKTGAHRSYDNRETKRSNQRECYCPGHRLEEPALDSLQGKDWQVAGDDDSAREEN